MIFKNEEQYLYECVRQSITDFDTSMLTVDNFMIVDAQLAFVPLDDEPDWIKSAFSDLDTWLSRKDIKNDIELEFVSNNLIKVDMSHLFGENKELFNFILERPKKFTANLIIDVGIFYQNDNYVYRVLMGDIPSKRGEYTCLLQVDSRFITLKYDSRKTYEDEKKKALKFKSTGYVQLEGTVPLVKPIYSVSGAGSDTILRNYLNTTLRHLGDTDKRTISVAPKLTSIDIVPEKDVGYNHKALQNLAHRLDSSWYRIAFENYSYVTLYFEVKDIKNRDEEIAYESLCNTINTRSDITMQLNVELIPIVGRIVRLNLNPHHVQLAYGYESNALLVVSCFINWSK